MLHAVAYALSLFTLNALLIACLPVCFTALLQG